MVKRDDEWNHLVNLKHLWVCWRCNATGNSKVKCSFSSAPRGDRSTFRDIGSSTTWTWSEEDEENNISYQCESLKAHMNTNTTRASHNKRLSKIWYVMLCYVIRESVNRLIKCNLTELCASTRHSSSSSRLFVNVASTTNTFNSVERNMTL